MIADVRKLAWREGWKTGKHPRQKHSPRLYDACPSCPLPDEYKKL
jgi:hypothetical protein